MTSLVGGGCAGLILAAGKSARMGSPKALLELGGEKIIDRLVGVFLRARLDPVIVVAHGATLEHARGLLGVRAIDGDPDAPMIDSIARALVILPQSTTRVVLQPVDAPFTNVAMIADLEQGWRGQSRVLVHDARPGHPVLISRALFPAVFERPVGGLSTVLAAHEVELVEWPTSEILVDIDTPEDLERWRAWARQAMN